MTARILDVEALRQVQMRIARGENAKEIAAVLGCSYNTLRTQCSRKKISLIPGTPLPTGFVRPTKNVDIAARVTPTTARDLISRAQARGIDVSLFVGLILNTVSNDGLYDAVLDGD